MDRKGEGSGKSKKIRSALNELLLQHYIIKRLLKILKAYRSYSVMKINTTRMNFSTSNPKDR